MDRRGFFRAFAQAGAPIAVDERREAAGLDRRSFLRWLGVSAAVGTAAAVTGIDPERLVWTPEQKLFTGWDLGETHDWTGVVTAQVSAGGGRNTLLTFDLITREALKILDHNLKRVSRFDRAFMEGDGWSHGAPGLKVGDRITIRGVRG